MARSPPGRRAAALPSSSGNARSRSTDFTGRQPARWWLKALAKGSSASLSDTLLERGPSTWRSLFPLLPLKFLTPLSLSGHRHQSASDRPRDKRGVLRRCYSVPARRFFVPRHKGMGYAAEAHLCPQTDVALCLPRFQNSGIQEIQDHSWVPLFFSPGEAGARESLSSWK